MKTHQKKWFTLVELIVVIVILAILTTIGFISLQSYGRSTRNSVRVSDIEVIRLAIQEDLLNGGNILDYVEAHGQEIRDANIAGRLATTQAMVDMGSGTTVNYKAGTVNATALGLVESDLRDPISNELYRVGVTTDRKGHFEVAATIERPDGQVSRVIWSYTDRTATQDVEGIGEVWSKRFQVTDGEFKRYIQEGDYLTGATITPGTQVLKVYDGWSILQLSEPLTGNTTAINIATTEVQCLIGGLEGTPACDGSPDAPYDVWENPGTGFGGYCEFNEDLFNGCTISPWTR